MRYFLLSLICLMSLLAGSCMVGPKYARPTVPMTPAYKEQSPASWKESQGWKPGEPADQALRGKWWGIFGDPQLNVLEDQVTVANQDLKLAEARYREAQALVRYKRGAEFPTLSTSPFATSLRDSSHIPYFTFPSNLAATGEFVLPFDLSYEIDFWGRIRRSVAAAGEEAQATAADLQTAKLSLHAELAIDYFELHSEDAQKQLLNDTVNAYTNALQLTINRFEGGAAPKSDVAQARTQLDTTRVEDTDVSVARSQYEHAIAVLVGKPPATFTLASSPLNLTAPRIPVGVPSDLLERRPDIAAAERRVTETNQEIGIARSAYFPTVVLSAAAGFEGTSPLNWFAWPSRFWAVGPELAETLFDAGQRRATSEGARSDYDATVAGYRQTTLTAFQQVEDNLAALRILEHEAQQQRQAVTSAQETLQLFMNRYKGGLDNYLQVITAQTAELANERNEIDILRRRMDASVLLIKALGGGWNVSKLPKLASLH
jgi:NodT family efflux transporter outer membrane factor (OMF) lipoprotein